MISFALGGVRARKAIAAAVTAAALVCGGAATARAQFGVVPGSFNVTALNRDGTIDTQAGSHPYEFVLNFAFNLNAEKKVDGLTRDIDIELPPGLVGDPNAVPRCSPEEFEGFQPECSGSTQVGELHSDIEGLGEIEAPVYNMVPPRGVPAMFGTSASGDNVFEQASVRTGGDYGVSVDTNNVPVNGVVRATAIIWGVPADKGHDVRRTCVVEGAVHLGCASGVVPKPFLTLPTSCTGPLVSRLTADSREEPNVLVGTEPAFSLDSGGNPAPLTGCERLVLEPAIKLAPDTAAADTPAGLTAEVKVGQGGLEAPEGLSSADLKDTKVVLPEGVAINPGQAAGLEACPYSQDGVGTEGPPNCPNGSKVGTVSIKTPLLEEELEGSVYILPANPPDLELLVAPADPLAGIYLKLIGRVHLDEGTGKLTTTFDETPQLPFSKFRLSFSGGAQAALTTPLRCGVYTSSIDFTPWGTPFQADDLTSDSFAITSGTGGAPCPPATLPFAPEMIAGSTTDQAGGYTDFSLLLTRPDDQQRISTLSFKTPEGLLGMIGQIPLCPEPQAQQGTCSSASQIGHTVVEAGPGPYPLVVPQPGRPPAPIYLTGPYKGAPYGLSIVVPLVVGPFNLGTVITRAKIEVDPLTSKLTVTTDPLPQTVRGVPADLRTINAVIDRPGFMFNPTDCSPQAFSGSATSIEGTTVPTSSHFQMGSCRSLTFKPNFKVSVTGKNTRKTGAGLTAKILYPTGALGANQASSQSNIAKVKVSLPRQLPSNIKALQRACPHQVFEANPAGCPAESAVGHAIAITPVLPVPVAGPAYFVSYGGAKFPELVVVLQGYGVTIDLHGETFIDEHTGITSSTFRSVPDVPVTSFELNLPQGPFSALDANTNLCSVKKLVMPTIFVGHNNASIKQNTPIAVTGCPKHKAPTHRAKKAGHHRKKKGK